MATVLFLLNEGPYGTERSFNALRLANTLAKRRGDELKVFLIGDAAACAVSGQKVPTGYYNVSVMLNALTRAGAVVGVCGSCMDARGLTDTMLADGCQRSTMEILADWLQWAEKTLVF